MKTLYLVRHAKSSWSEASIPDRKRPLNKRGQRDAPFMAKLIAQRGVRANLIYSSPAKRALTTAQFFAQAQDYNLEDIEVRDIIYEGFTRDLINVVRQTDSSFHTIFMFGHNPEFTSFANQYSDEMIDNVPTCGIVKITGAIEDWKDFSPDTFKVESFDYPKKYFK